ncbi:MAG: HigA family addiction module antitoxin [Candidatus Absconditabacteria bacterium]
MLPKSNIVFHPGEYLKDELDARIITQSKFADILGKSNSVVSELINGKRNITAEWAILIGYALDQDPQTWLNLQYIYDLHVAKQKISQDKLNSIIHRRNLELA